jgi:hypothetical protein
VCQLLSEEQLEAQTQMKPTDHITADQSNSKYHHSPLYAESRIHKYVSPLKENQSDSNPNDTTTTTLEATKNNSEDNSSKLVFNVVASINETIQDALSKVRLLNLNLK